jgi:RNA polymerase sigma-32 factor
MIQTVEYLPAKSSSDFSLGLGVAGNVANIDAYIRSANMIPMLTQEEEWCLATKLRDENDVHSAHRLVTSHLRLVISISRGFLGYGLPQADLIQEGNIGLMKAVKKFDLDQGARLVTYATHWIRAEIHEYILRNWRMSKIATTKAQRKLFFNLRSYKGSAGTMTPDQVDSLAKKLDVKPEEVREMEVRLGAYDMAVDLLNDDEDGFSPLSYLSNPDTEPTAMLEVRQYDRMQSEGLTQALETLDARSRRIIESRWLDTDDNSGPRLLDLASEYGVSSERIRQIESAALKKMKTTLACYH